MSFAMGALWGEDEPPGLTGVVVPPEAPPVVPAPPVVEPEEGAAGERAVANDEGEFAPTAGESDTKRNAQASALAAALRPGLPEGRAEPSF